MPEYFFSIITSNLNSGEELAVTAESIASQTFNNIQWIISDGASTDNSVNLIEHIAPKDTFINSSKDSGIYNAWNKSLPLIKGEWVIFLGAGDTFANVHVLNRAFSWINENICIEDTICYGSVLKIKKYQLPKDGKLDDKVWGGVEGRWSLGRPSMPCHQGVFHRAELFKKHPIFDESFRIAADSEIVLRELMGNRGKHMNILITHMLAGGISDNKKYRALLVLEIIRVNIKLGIFLKRPILQVAILIFSWLRYSLIPTRNQ